MKILLRYYLKEFFKYFILSVSCITAILLLAELFDKIDEFYAQKTPFYLVLEYLLFQVPKSLLWASPVASLLSILFTISIAIKWKETVAIKAAGGSIKKLLSPFILFGVIISLTALLLGESLVPVATQKASWIRNTKILKNVSRVSYREGVLWIKGLDGSLIRTMGFVEDENRALKISVFNFTPSFEFTKRIEAEEAEWVNNKWILKNVIVFDFINNSTTKHNSVEFTALEELKIFKSELKKPEEMTFVELYNYNRRLETAGFKNLRYVTDLYGKLAYPMVNLVMIIFGMAIALHSKLGGGIRAGGLGLLVIISYWVIFSLSTSLGNTGILPPAITPWISPVIFGSAGSYIYLRIRE